ncbi:hypothetical protein [Prolixibacter bellariivorans]|uniref:hypothetical protein n=1 Tax=Prolixibacter bellariivorans TaxID=314319 RepID=UPI001900FAB4|nr:hypothetical protein [Prolixibacter bellariivorans]
MIQRIHTFIFVFLASATVAHAQLSLNRDKCREMALEYSKQISKANTQKEKATYDKKAYRANYFPKLSLPERFCIRPRPLITRSMELSADLQAGCQRAVTAQRNG